MSNPNSAAQAAMQHPIDEAIVILTEEADSLSECHTLKPEDWAGEPEAKARYDHVQAVVAALSKLRAPVADERAAFETAMQNRGQNVDRWPNPHGGYRRLSTEIAWYAWNDRAALASAPVAGEAQPSRQTLLDAIWRHGNARAMAEHNIAYRDEVRNTADALLALFDAAPQPSAEPARILFPSHLRKMWSGGEVQAWLDQHQGVTPPPATAKGSLARYRQWKAEQDQAAAPCTCPSGDGSLHHPCPAHPRTNEGQA